MKGMGIAALVSALGAVPIAYVWLLLLSKRPTLEFLTAAGLAWAIQAALAYLAGLLLKEFARLPPFAAFGGGASIVVLVDLLHGARNADPASVHFSGLLMAIVAAMWIYLVACCLVGARVALNISHKEDAA